MKTSINVKVLSAFKKLGVMALIMATLAVFFTACKQTGGKPKSKYVITFSVKGENGTLKAMVDGSEIASGKEVEEGKTVTFIAVPENSYGVKGWMLDGSLVDKAGKNKEYPLIVTKPATVSVSFELLPKHTITFSVKDWNGKLKAKIIEATGEVEITSGEEIEEGKTVRFIAEANEGYRVKSWTLDGTSVTEAGKNKEYSLIVTKPATVSVSFEFIPPGKAILTLAPMKRKFSIRAETADDSIIQVEGCTTTTLKSNVETELRANGRTVTFTGCITELRFGFSSQFTSLDVQDLAALRRLYCSFNELTDLNVQGLTSLQELECYDNKLTDLNVQGLTSLQELDCDNNKLTELNVQGLTSLQKLSCDENQLNSLNVQGLSNLQGLYCSKNKLTELNMQGLTSLQGLYCEYNQLTSLNVQGCVALQELECYKNQLTELDLQGCSSLQKLLCNYNQLTSLNVQGCSSLQELECLGNKLTDLNVQGLTNLEVLTCWDNQLTELDLQGHSSLQKLECDSNKLTKLNVQGLTNLEVLTCRWNQLTELDVHDCWSLRKLVCENNQLKSLNVSGCTALEQLYCAANQIKAEAMTKILNALPARKEDNRGIAVLYTAKPDVNEGNCKDFTTPESLKKAFDEAKSKHWALRKWSANGWWADI